MLSDRESIASCIVGFVRQTVWTYGLLSINCYFYALSFLADVQLSDVRQNVQSRDLDKLPKL